MGFVKKALAVTAVLLVAGTGLARAGTDLNEVAAFLVFPGVVATFDTEHAVDTFITITNASDQPVEVHISFVNGEVGAEECYECNFDIFLTGNDTETLVVTRDFFTNNTQIISEDRDDPFSTGASYTCPHVFGFITANAQDPDTKATLTSNVLLGEEVVVDYSFGAAVSVPAVSFQGKNGGDGDRWYEFDDLEYGKMAKVVAADFLAPNAIDEQGFHQAFLTLFTLGFERQAPPITDCSVTGYDAFEHPFSRSFRFGCWTTISLEDIHPEFAFPNLGINALLPDTHGWLKLNCKVDHDANGTFDAIGGVQGAISHAVGPNTQLAFRNLTAWNVTNNPLAWSRLLYQSVTTGDAVTLHLENAGGGLN